MSQLITTKYNMSVLEAIEKAKEFSSEEVEATPEAVIPEEVPVEKPVENPEETPTKVIEETPKPEEVVETPAEEAATETSKKSKIKVDYLSFLEEHDSVISAYKAEKNADYSKMGAEEILRKSLKLKYPNLSSEDVDEELKDRYGLGENTEDLDGEDLVALRAKQRKMKIDAAEAVSALEAYRDSLTLPDFELEIPDTEVAEPVNIEEIVQAKAKEQLEADLDWRKNVWTPEINKAVEGISNITKKVNLGGNIGEIEVDIALDEADKKAVSEYLAGWIYHPSDSVYLKDGEAPDLTAFAKDRGAAVLSDKILEAFGKAVVEKYKSLHMKNEVINFNDDTTTKQIPKHETGGAHELADLLRGKN